MSTRLYRRAEWISAPAPPRVFVPENRAPGQVTKPVPLTIIWLSTIEPGPLQHGHHPTVNFVVESLGTSSGSRNLPTVYSTRAFWDRVWCFTALGPFDRNQERQRTLSAREEDR